MYIPNMSAFWQEQFSAYYASKCGNNTGNEDSEMIMAMKANKSSSGFSTNISDRGREAQDDDMMDGEMATRLL